MSVVIKRGDIFDQGADILVNPVNCIGVMGAGLAKKFKSKFPDYYDDYRVKCEQSKIQLGKIDDYIASDPRIVSFPTKYHYSDDSDIIDICLGLIDLRDYLRLQFRPYTVAVPALGCGLGKLPWDKVKRLMVGALSDIDKATDVIILEPQ